MLLVKKLWNFWRQLLNYNLVQQISLLYHSYPKYVTSSIKKKKGKKSHIWCSNSWVRGCQGRRPCWCRRSSCCGSSSWSRLGKIQCWRCSISLIHRIVEPIDDRYRNSSHWSQTSVKPLLISRHAYLKNIFQLFHCYFITTNLIYYYQNITLMTSFKFLAKYLLLWCK